jgi:hypothetical protein
MYVKAISTRFAFGISTPAIRAISFSPHSILLVWFELALSLFVLGVFADNHYVTFSLDNLALVTDFLYGRLYFH